MANGGTDSVAEAAVVGINDELTGQAVNAFVALKDGTESSDQVKKDLILQVRKSIGPFAAPKAIFVVPDLPKTRSGKIMRRIMRKILAGEEDQLGDITTVSGGMSWGRVVTRCVCLVEAVLTALGAALGSVGSGEDHRHCTPGQAQEVAAGGGRRRECVPVRVAAGRRARRSGAGVGDDCPGRVWNDDDACRVLDMETDMDMAISLLIFRSRAQIGIGNAVHEQTRTHRPAPHPSPPLWPLSLASGRRGWGG